MYEKQVKYLIFCKNSILQFYKFCVIHIEEELRNCQFYENVEFYNIGAWVQSHQHQNTEKWLLVTGPNFFVLVLSFPTNTDCSFYV